MKQYIGTKAIAARPMSRGEYNEYQGWTPPEGEDQDVDGYLVEYLDGGKPNHPTHKGYISWSPKEQFENAYQPTDAMNFGNALVALKDGKRIARAGWNGKGMFAFMIPSSVFKVNREPLLSAFGEGTEITYNHHMALKQVDGSMSEWVPSVGDCFAEDWMIVSHA